MNAIEIKNITKQFKDHVVLKGIDLTVNEGEVFTLLGENGAGKTTLINILTTLSHPNSGSVKIEGNDLNQGDIIRELISLNSQSNTVDDSFSGYENLKLIAELRNVKNVAAEINRVSDRLNLETFLNQKVLTYSGGMRRRLDIAMSLIGDPEIIFLDEPSTGVDPKNRLEIWKIIKELRDSGKTIFLTTQYLDEADQLSDHIGFINDGKIVLYGTPEEIKKDANNQFSLTVETKEVEKAEKILADNNISYTLNENSVEVSEIDSQFVLDTIVNNKIDLLDFHKVETNLETIFLNTTQRK
ncbi:ABC transporter ATP-binding protein [Lactobacillus sp. YT155]|uniref:ABC transporter ATP-binding protein n=1 Tax=Lactobacillus sp. YT155 TaxID=3060955 RepID=UPI00265E9E25|nr:ABC transporter ATP-binding protein [Lactobacillus sp. YT155]MDO1605649.1 ABC transporter ATP-binding protein [Lactobacillus sp. YT155]